MNNTELYRKAIRLLEELIRTPSFSGQEDKAAGLIANWLADFQIESRRIENNVWAVNKHFDIKKPSILLNSHIDTVRPNKSYTRDPYEAKTEGGKLYGLGSNDAGGSLVSLLALFAYYFDRDDLKYNLIIAATGEEENSGIHGLKKLLKSLPPIDFAVVGEPTGMQLAIAEKGLLVLDGYASGISGHAAHENTENAIYNAIEDINWIRNYQFPKNSDTLGKVKMSVTQIRAGEQHNVVPSGCNFVVDVRINDRYSNREIFEFIDAHTKSEMVARSFRLNSSSIPADHPIVLAGIKLGISTYGSPTMSDQANLSCPSLKLGPGDSARSHSADEFIYLSEIDEAIKLYIELFNEIL